MVTWARALRGRARSTACTPSFSLARVSSRYGAMPHDVSATVAVTRVDSAQDVKRCQDLRMEVFVAGQGVPVELELEFEEESIHFLATASGEPVGTGRLRPTGCYVKFERVQPLACTLTNRGAQRAHASLLHCNLDGPRFCCSTPVGVTDFPAGCRAGCTWNWGLERTVDANWHQLLTPTGVSAALGGKVVFLHHAVAGPIDTTRHDSAPRAVQVATLQQHRGKGIGKAIMATMLRHARMHHSELLPKLHAQTHALDFYAQLGWQQYGAEFDDAGIPHVAMVWVPPDGAGRAQLAAQTDPTVPADIRALLDA